MPARIVIYKNYCMDFQKTWLKDEIWAEKERVNYLNGCEKRKLINITFFNIASVFFLTFSRLSKGVKSLILMILKSMSVSNFLRLDGI